MKYIQDLRNRFAAEKLYPIETYFIDNDIEKELSLLDKTIGHIKRNKKLYKKLIVILALFALNTNCSFAESGIDRAGNKIYNKIIGFSYWIILIKGSIDIIQN